MAAWCWDYWVAEALLKLESLKVMRSLRPIHLIRPESNQTESDELEFYDGLRQWDRASVEVQISETTFQKWLQDIPSSGDDTVIGNGEDDDGAGPCGGKFKKLLIFSGNDYLGLSSHPTVIKAAVKAAQLHGMGPRGSALICGYTNYHRLLESALADLKKKEDCLLCPTGFAANMALITAVGSVGLLLAEGGKPKRDERVAIFSDALNHASIIDGIRLAEKQGSLVNIVYRHCDMVHLNSLLSSCTMKKKVVVTDRVTNVLEVEMELFLVIKGPPITLWLRFDPISQLPVFFASLFSMDGDFAPIAELVKLRRKHGFLLAIDDAHATLVCGKTGGGAAEKFKCENDVDICIGTLSKASGCHGGFIACSKKWKQLIQSRGRSFIFSTSTPVPIAAAAHAAVNVAKQETWRRKAIWNRVLEFRAMTRIPITSPIISLIVGSEVKALEASRHLLKSGFHVTAIRPPTVPSNSCRLRIALSAVHTRDDLRKLVTALSECINFEEIGFNCKNYSSKL